MIIQDIYFNNCHRILQTENMDLIHPPSPPRGMSVAFFLLKLKVVSLSVASDSWQSHEQQPTRFLCPWNSPGQNPRVGCHSLLQGIFLTQEWNPCLLHCRKILYQLSHQEALFPVTTADKDMIREKGFGELTSLFFFFQSV